MELTIGYIGYEPFVNENEGGFDGPSRALSDEVAQFADAVVYKRCSWSDFSSEIDHGSVDLVVDPIFPSQSRRIQIVPYFELVAAVLVYPKSKRPEIRPLIRAIENAIQNYRHGDAERQIEDGSDTDDLANSIHEQLARFPADESGRKSIAASAGVFESDLLTMLGIDHLIKSSGNIVQDGVDALASDHAVLTDIVSAHQLLDKLDRKRYTYDSLFGKHLFWISAGAPVHVNRNINEDLIESRII